MQIGMVVRKHPILSYFVLAIAWSYLYWQLLFTIFPIDPTRGPTLMHILLAAVGGSPSLFGLLVIYWGQGRAGLRALLARLSLWRVEIGWYVAALLLFPGLNALTYILYRGLGGEAYVVNLGALSFGIAAGIMASLLEEFGWRGFALPALQQRYSALASSLIIGLGWGLWHLRLNVTQYAQYGSLAVPLLLLSAPVNLTASAVLMAWIHNNARGSMLLMLLAHLSVTSGSLLFQPPAAAPGWVFLRWQLLWAGVQWAAVAVVLVREGAQRLTRGDLPALARWIPPLALARLPSCYSEGMLFRVIGKLLRSITLIKSVHTVIFVLLSGLLAALLYEVVVDRITILTSIAVTVFFAEGVILIVSGWKCPLTVYAERLGSTHGQVTDIFLPKWFADHVFIVYGGLFAVALLLLVIRLLS